MTVFDAIILGIVEGFTEFLPISSTAHLILVSRLVHLPESAFLSTFIIAIQVGAIASLIFLYRARILRDWETMKRVAAAFIPTAIIGFLMYKLLTGYLLENVPVIAAALVVGGVILLIFERWRDDRITDLSRMPYRTAILIGCIQALAIVPGVSRAGATIVGGTFLGVGRAAIVEFSFLLAIPTILAATGYDLLKTGAALSGREWGLLATGFLVSFAAAYTGVRFLLRFITSHSFAPFGWYRIALGALILAVLVV